MEEVHYPKPKQVRFAYQMIDAGARLILGHHSHTFQPIERYKNGLIAYSLGNFQFWLLRKPCTRESALLRVSLSKTGIEGFECVPVRINDDFSTSLMSGEQKESFKNNCARVSAAFEAKKFNDNFWYEEIADAYLEGNMEAWKTRIRKYGFRHFVQYVRWLVSPFVLMCYFGLLRKRLKYKKAMVHNFVKDFIKYLPAQLAPALVGFLSIPVITKAYNPEQYGNYSLVLASIAVLMTFAGWVPTAIIRFFPFYDGLRKNDFIKTSILLSLVSTVIIGLAGLLITSICMRNASGELVKLVYVGIGCFFWMLFLFRFSIFRVPAAILGFLLFTQWDRTCSIFYSLQESHI